MIDLLRRNPLIAALGLACAVLAAIVVFELVMAGSNPGSAGARKSAAAEAKLLPPISAAAPDQVYPETVNRPLWIPTRRPAPAPVVAAASFAPGQFILQGVIVAGGTQIALLKEKTSGRMHRVEKGREVNGIQVAEVEAERVTLAQGDAREVIELRVQLPGAPGAPAAPAAASAAGPFATSAAPAPAAAAPPPGAAAPAPSPAAPPAGNPFGAPPRPPKEQVFPGPLPPGTQPTPVNPTPGTVPQQATSAPMTPEELLARRRARRNQSP